VEKMRGSRVQPVEIPATFEGRVPPHDDEVEKALLSALMIDPATLDRVLEFLKPEHFYTEAHRRIYEACVELRQKGQGVDAVQVASWLKDRERLAQVGGMPYIGQVLLAAPALTNVAEYGRTIYEKWRIRQLILTCQRVAAQGYLDYGEAQQFIDGAEQQVYEIARVEGKSSVEKLKGVIVRAFRSLTEAANRGNRITGVPTGFARYDRVTSGLHPGDLTIVAARPGMGKTSFVLNIATNVALPTTLEMADDANDKWQQPGRGVVVFSLEMPREQLANRMLCSEARVDVSLMRSGGIQQAQWNKLTEAASKLSQSPIWIDDSPSLSLLEMRAKVRRLQAEHDKHDADGKVTSGLGLVIVDYLQLMKGRDGLNSREQEISEISRGLKALAKELKLPVIALSQLNRSVETRSEKGKRPQLSDLRESGAIEQDADNICFIYRDDYYNKESTAPNTAELIIAKQRNGATETVHVGFVKQYTRFEDLKDGEYPSYEDS
jgi:replicative DNA helicase